MQICVRAHDLEVKGTEKILKGLIDSGADGAQLVCYKSFKDIKKAPAEITHQQAEKIGKAFKEANKSIQLIGAYFNPVHSSQSKVDDGIEIFKDYLKYRSYLGCSVVGSETGSYNDEPWVYHPKNRTDEAIEKVADVFRELCDYAKEYGAFVAIEGASGHVCYSVKALAKAEQLINRDNLKIIFDLYNFLDKENCKDYIEILKEGIKTFAGRIHCFHIKDCIFTEDGYKQCDVGEGDLDFASIIKIIKNYDKDAVLILEGTKKDSVKTSIEFLTDKWQKA